MSFKSKNFYYRVKGIYALFTDPSTKGGGENFTYSVPTRQALTGITDAAYFKPTIKNIVDEVKIINPIQTETKGVRALVKQKSGADLNYVTYLSNVEYLVKYHFIWDENRPDLEYDRNIKKHEAIAERSLKKGGRRDVFLGTRECLADLDLITAEEYNNYPTAYENTSLSFGIMFHSFSYPTVSGDPLISHFANTHMEDGIIRFKPQEEVEISRELSNYNFKVPEKIKGIDEEYDMYLGFD